MTHRNIGIFLLINPAKKGKVADLLVSNANALGIDIRTNCGVSSISLPTTSTSISPDDDDSFTIQTSDNQIIKSKSVVIATDGKTAQNIVSSFPGFESMKDAKKQAQRSVGCIYYGFNTPVPVKDPILILNGAERKPVTQYPVNNVCFPSTVNAGYAPDGCHLCSVTILEPALNAFEGRDEELDEAVREQLKSWFPDYATDIETRWENKGIYRIKNAQPGQFKGPVPANVNGGRDCTVYRGQNLPKGLFLCGDHMSTATLNGALESGVKAGKEVAKFL